MWNWLKSAVEASVQEDYRNDDAEDFMPDDVLELTEIIHDDDYVSA